MIIQVLHTYSGRLTKREKILPGVYDTEHNALYGIAQYLVDNGHALVLDLAPESSPTPTKVTESDNALNKQILGDRVKVEDGQLSANVPLEIGIDPAIHGEDKTVETPAKKKRK